MERWGWVRSLPREDLPLLRRSRLLAWEVSRLEERQRDKLPSHHLWVRLGERVPPIRSRRERALRSLAHEVSSRVEERNRLLDALPSLALHERDQIAAYRPVSETQCIRLTEAGRKALCSFRFSSFGFADALDPARFEARLHRFTLLFHALSDAAWWRERTRTLYASSPERGEADALWLAAILSRTDAEKERQIEAAEETYRGFSHYHLWRQDPLPLCLLLLSADAPRSLHAAVETNNALAGAGLGVGVSVMAAATALVAGTPPSELSFRIAELHHFWKTWVGYGLAFSDALMPSAARLATARRPVERTASLLHDLDNRTTRFYRMNDRATRVAATLLADLPLDYQDRGEGADLFAHEEPYVQRLMHRYRAFRTALLPRCSRERNGAAQATVLAGVLAACPGEPDAVIELFDHTRLRLSRAHLPDSVEAAGIVLLLMESHFHEAWGVDHARCVWDLYFAHSA